MSEDIKWVITSRISTRDKQYNGKKRKVQKGKHWFANWWKKWLFVFDWL